MNQVTSFHSHISAEAVVFSYLSRLVLAVRVDVSVATNVVCVYVGVGPDCLMVTVVPKLFDRIVRIQSISTGISPDLVGNVPL